MQFKPTNFTNEELLNIYHKLLLPRTIEDKMLIMLRQGKISKWFSGYGQEAISVGAVLGLNPSDYILPMHRNLGVFTSRGIELSKLFMQFQGKKDGFTQGHDRSFHFGTNEHHIVGMISHLGPQLGIADGIALANKLADNGASTLVFTGDGGASEGDFHEALNVAAVWDLPVIFVVENNGWGLSTPSNEQFRCKQFIDKGIGYGMEARQIDGNNILEVIDGIRSAADYCNKEQKPILIEAITFRIRGHEEASGTKYYPDGIIDKWQEKDPVINFENFLIEKGILKRAEADALKKQYLIEIQTAFDEATAAPIADFTANDELKMLFKEYDFKAFQPENEKMEMRFIDAISDGLNEAMQKHENLILMGQDIAEYGGVFKITDGFVQRYGKERVRNTPLCESAIVGAALGLSIKGYKAMVEMQFADFVTCGFNQIVNNLAKIHWRWQQNADVVIRMPTGAGVGAGPYHSQSNEAWFFHVPGLQILYPSTPEDAKGLLIAAFENPNPVLFFEHKALYRSISSEVALGYYNTEIGKARIHRKGQEMSIICYGMGVHWALDYLKEHPQIDAEVVDLRSLAPLDTDSIFSSVRKTGKVLVLHEDNLTGGIGAEISALITEHCFQQLDAPVIRLASLDTPVPFAGNLETQFLAKNRLHESIQKLLNY